VIRYEDLIRNPKGEIDKIASALGNNILFKTRKKDLSLRSKRDALNEDDCHAINDICGESMRFFGYEK